MRAVPLLVIALVTGCNKGPSCADQKRLASTDIKTARIEAMDTSKEQRNFDTAKRKLEALRAFQVKLIQGVSKVRDAAGAGCPPKMICCEKAAEWIAAEAKAPEGERPTWRLPAFGTNELAPADLAAHIAAYDEAASKLASLLQKGAPLAEVTAACTTANTEIDLVRSMSPNAVTTSVDAAEADHTAAKATLAEAKGRAAMFQQWEDAITSNTKFEVPPPSPTDTVKVTEAKAAATSVQACLK